MLLSSSASSARLSRALTPALLLSLAGSNAAALAQSGGFTWAGGMNFWHVPSAWNEEGGPPRNMNHTASIGGLLGAACTIAATVDVGMIEVQSGFFPVRLDLSPGVRLTTRRIDNMGMIGVGSSNGSTQSTFIAFTAAENDYASLTGFGTLTLNALNSTTEAQLVNGSANWATTLLHRSGHTIAGSGRVQIDMINEGRILADSPYREIELRARGFASNFLDNRGRIESVNNGIVRMTQGIVTQTGAGRVTSNGGQVIVEVGAINGGLVELFSNAKISLTTATLENLDLQLNGFTLEALSSTSTLRNITLTGSGNFHVRGGATLSLDMPMLHGNFGMLINSGGPNAAAVTTLQAVRPITLSGSGEIRLDAASPSNLASALITSTQITPITFNGVSVRGSGLINADYINGSVFSADRPGRALRVAGWQGSNGWIMQAENQGELIVNNTVTQSAQGIIRARANSCVTLDRATINGGSIIAEEGGRITSDSVTINGSAVNLNGSTLNAGFTTFNRVTTLGGGLRVTPSRSVTFALVAPDNTFTNNHEIIIEPGTTSTTNLTFQGPTTIAGSGNIILNSPSNPALSVLQSANTQETLTIGQNQLIAGTGTIAGLVTGRGVISPGTDTNPIGEIRLGALCQISLAPSSILAIDVAGTAQGQFDRISNTPNFGNILTLNGTLTVRHANAFQGLRRGESIEIIRASSPLRGRFNDVNFPTPPTGKYVLEYTANSVRLALACLVDFNSDQQIDFFDYLDFVAAFDSEAPAADFNNDGQTDFFDYLDFVAAFAENC